MDWISKKRFVLSEFPGIEVVSGVIRSRILGPSVVFSAILRRGSFSE